MSSPFIFQGIMVDYDPVRKRYTCYDQLVGLPIGHFEFNAGPGWVFFARRGYVMDELRSLANFQDYLHEHLDHLQEKSTERNVEDF